MADSEETKTSQREIADLLKRTRSPFVGERAAAEQEFRELGADGIDALMGLVQAKIRTWQRRRRAYFWLLATFLGIAVPLMAYNIALGVKAGIAGDGHALGGYFGLAFGGILGGWGGGVLGGFAWLLMPPSELFMAANLLAQVEDLRGIGPLLRVLTLRMADAELRHAAAKALCRLLPKIDEGSGNFLSAEDRGLLSRYLLRSQPDKEQDLVTGILTALSWTGDSDSLHALRQFNERTEKLTPSGALTKAMRVSLERLESRVQAALKGENLLRPHSSDSERALLLKPSESTAANDEALLLRAGSQD